jgi:hypothetical protein
MIWVWTLVSISILCVAVAEQVIVRDGEAGVECEVRAAGKKIDDTPAILKAFQSCNGGGKIIFPKGEEYWIATKLNPVVKDIRIEWRGQWKVCRYRWQSLTACPMLIIISVLGRSSLLAQEFLPHHVPESRCRVRPERVKHPHRRPWNRRYSRKRRRLVQR